MCQGDRCQLRAPARPPTFGFLRKPSLARSNPAPAWLLPGVEPARSPTLSAPEAPSPDPLGASVGRAGEVPAGERRTGEGGFSAARAGAGAGSGAASSPGRGGRRAEPRPSQAPPRPAAALAGGAGASGRPARLPAGTRPERERFRVAPAAPPAEGAPSWQAAKIGRTGRAPLGPLPPPEAARSPKDAAV